MFHRQQSFWVLVVAVVSLLLTSNARALDFWLKEGELRKNLAGVTIDGQYVDTRSFRESYNHDGTLRYSEEAGKRAFTGKWSIVRHRFCTIYDQSNTGGCFRVRQVSDNCFEFFFDSRTVAEARRSTLRNPTWTARAWRTDRVSTCEERPMV